MFQDGQTLGDFEILGRLGQGGMGAVYKARQTSLERFVALKTLQASLASDPEYIARFHREAVAAAALNHPNLVQVYAAGESDGLHWFAMEYVEGESAQGRLKRKGRIEPVEAIAIAMHVATALDYGWRKAHLIHRDIKPDNIFLSGDGEVKLGDLGLAKSAGQTQGLTMTGASMGTPHYISPEQAEGKKDTDLRTDIYSLGCTLYHMLSGQVPYPDESAVVVMMKHVSAPVPDLRSVWPECPAELASAVMKMMQKQPAARQQSYEEVNTDLRRAYDVLTGAPAPSASVSKEKKRGMPVAAWAGVGVVLLAAIAALFYFAPWKKGWLTEAERADKARERAGVTAGGAPAASPAFPQAGQPVNLLALVDVKRDAIAGEWKIINGELHGGGAEFARLAFPYEAPMEYELRISFTRHADSRPVSRRNSVAQHLALGGHDVMWNMGGFSNRFWSFEKVAGKMGNDNPTTVESGVEDGRRYDCITEVRRDALTVTVDGVRVMHYKTTGSDLSVTDQWNFPEPKKLGVGCQNDAVFHSVEVIPFLAAATPSLSPQVSASTPSAATKDVPFINTLGMKFVPVPIGGGPTKDQRVLFGVWDVRVQDYAVYAASAGAKKVDDAWTKQQRDGVPAGRELNHPVVGVSWEDAQGFCQWLTEKETAEGKLPKGWKYRLPSDEEWSWAVGLPPEVGSTPEEKAGKNSVDFPWGKDWPPTKKVGNYADETFHGKFPLKKNEKENRMENQWIEGYTDGYATTSPVGSFPANAYGLYDMGGNVWQWCEDWWNAEHKERVLRGASWSNYDRGTLLSSDRSHIAPGLRSRGYGFRCVLGESAR